MARLGASAPRERDQAGALGGQRPKRVQAWPKMTSPSTVAVGVGVQPAATRASRSSSALGW